MILTMEDNDCFDLGGLHLQSGSCGVADMSANSSVSFLDYFSTCNAQFGTFRIVFAV